MCLDVVLFVLIVVGILCAFWTWISVSFPRLGKFLAVMSSNIFFLCFFFKKKKPLTSHSCSSFTILLLNSLSIFLIMILNFIR